MNRFVTAGLGLLVAGLAPAAQAQTMPTTMRTDAIWARATTETLTLDGMLNEASWATAESVRLTYGQRAGDPGSGYKDEGNGVAPQDPLVADVKFLVRGNQLYIGATVEDKSIGGVEFNRFDGFLMKFRDASARNDIGEAEVREYFYAWMATEGVAAPGALPQFMGPYGDRANTDNVARWDAATTVVGTTNDDATADTRYVMEMRFDLGVLGYDATQAGGDQIGFSFSVYDVDGFFPFNDAKFSSNRTWWESGFGFGPNVGRVFVDPAVTTTTTVLPGMPYDLIIANGGSFATPTVDGALDEPIWDQLTGFDIRFGDAALRQTYPGIGALTSGQYQPDIDGNGTNALPTVVDPADATVKWFYQGTRLYVGVDVRDAAISANDTGLDFWDGFRLSLNDNVRLEPNDHYLFPHALDVRLNTAGQLVAEGGLAALLKDNPNAATFAATINGTLNNSADADTGYRIEMAIDLTALGYPADLSDRVLYAGANVFDYDLLDDPTASYGSRAWFFREAGPDRAAAYAYLNPMLMVAGEAGPGAATGLVLLGAAPNPTRGATTLHYRLPEAGRATIEVTDALGRRVAAVDAGAQAAGEQGVSAPLALPAGVYLYTVRLDGASGVQHRATGRFTVVR